MLIPYYRFTVRVYHIKSKATELGTFSPISTTSETSLTNITLSTIAYTQSTMYKYLQRHIRTSMMDIFYFNKRKFTSQYHLGDGAAGDQQDISQESYFLRSTIIHLCAGM